MAKKNFLTVTDFTSEQLLEVIDKAIELKNNPELLKDQMKDMTLLMIFDKPSLRTRVSFEVGMTKMGGHGIYYNVATSPLGKKETMADTARTAARYCDLIMARIGSHADMEELGKYSDVPVINAMTNYTHPCQIVADLQIFKEKKGEFKGKKLTYMGDSNNNVTHSLMLGCAMVGMDIYVGCPKGAEYSPEPSVVEKATKIAAENGSKVVVTHDAVEAAKDADAVYTDSWMSYHIPQDQKEARIKLFTPYQVNSELMSHAKPDAVFMNCLPAMRGMEQTAEVVDGPQSIVFDEAENRLHAQNAIMLKLIGKF